MMVDADLERLAAAGAPSSDLTPQKVGGSP